MKTIKFFLLIALATTSFNSSENVPIKGVAHPPNSEVIGTKTYYNVYGSSEAIIDIVLIHGMASNHLTWEKQVNYFKTIGRVMNLTLPYAGNGYDFDATKLWTIDELIDSVYYVLTKECFKNAVVIGHSSGYIIGRQLALKYPDIVSKLVNVDFSPFIWPPHGHPAREGFVEWLQGYFLPNILSGSLKQKFIEQMCPDGTTNYEIRDYFSKCMELMPNQLAHNLFCQITSEEIYSIQPCNIPVLSIHKKENLEVFAYLHLIHPKIQIEVVPFPSGHFVHMEHPTWINQLIAEFILHNN
jgi:pimeloyl-ACP methyl ester carboxylesterase